MSDRDVLDMALQDQEQARNRIEELKQQIADEEAKIERIGAFVDTYREYEQRVSGDGSTEANEEGEPANGAVHSSYAYSS